MQKFEAFCISLSIWNINASSVGNNLNLSNPPMKQLFRSNPDLKDGKTAMNRQVCKKKHHLVRLILLASGLFLIISAGCHEYPSGASVAIQIKGVSRQFKPVMEFESWLLERMKTFSDAKKDFTVTGGVVADSNAVPAGVTHIFMISIDSINLIPLSKYKAAVDTANETADKLSPLNYISLPGEPRGFNKGYLINKIAYDANAHPSMGISLAIRDVKTGRNTWDYSKEIEIESTAAMPEVEQMGQLFSVLKGVVSDEAGFLTLKK